jgi:hypothetical protein
MISDTTPNTISPLLLEFGEKLKINEFLRDLNFCFGSTPTSQTRRRGKQ